jgi:hypothetical protein
VFHKQSGIYIIHANHYSVEDMENTDLIEGIGHYIVYNAGTRVLFLNPEVVVLEDTDFADIIGFLKKMERSPMLLRIPISFHVNRFVRKLCYVESGEGSSTEDTLPHA